MNPAANSVVNKDGWHSACGKVILFGEHAVVYGVEAIAGGIANAMHARVHANDQGISIRIPQWDIHREWQPQTTTNDLLEKLLGHLVDHLGLKQQSFDLELDPGVPHASGLGASAAVAVASIRALSAHFNCSLNDTQINQLALGCERIAHGSPSGLDNTLATYGGLLRYQKSSNGAVHKPLECPKPIPLIIALSGKKGFTAATVQRVAEAKAREPQRYKAIFESISRLTEQAIPVIANSQFRRMAELMNHNQEMLRQMGVSCPEIERVIEIACNAGAWGAKLTGSGDGGAVVICAGEQTPDVLQALRTGGIAAFPAQLGKL